MASLPARAPCRALYGAQKPARTKPPDRTVVDKYKHLSYIDFALASRRLRSMSFIRYRRARQTPRQPVRLPEAGSRPAAKTGSDNCGNSTAAQSMGGELLQAHKRVGRKCRQCRKSPNRWRQCWHLRRFGRSAAVGGCGHPVQGGRARCLVIHDDRCKARSQAVEQAHRHPPSPETRFELAPVRSADRDDIDDCDLEVTNEHERSRECSEPMLLVPAFDDVQPARPLLHQLKAVTIHLHQGRRRIVHPYDPTPGRRPHHPIAERWRELP
jgi:hypothetical protein